MLYQYPCIESASHLHNYVLLIEWSSGEKSIFDASLNLSNPRGLLYRSIPLFKKFCVEDHYLYWGDEDFIIMRDDIYENSTPCFISMSSGKVIFVSMSRIKTMSPYPDDKMSPIVD